MTMRMVGIRHVRVPVPLRLMAMMMAMRPCRHLVMHVIMVTIVMHMGVFVLHRFVGMFMTVRLGEV